MNFNKMTKRELIDELRKQNKKISGLESKMFNDVKERSQESKNKYRILFNKTNDLVFLHPLTAEGKFGAFSDIMKKHVKYLNIQGRNYGIKPPSMLWK